MATGGGRDQRARQGPEAGRLLPPLDYLLAFEAAADAGGFAAASRRLNISETALSRKVRLLEQHFGLSFFRRGHRAIALTAEGQDFLGRIRPALDGLRDAASAAFRSGHDRPVILAATNSVASLWLAPRLHGLRQQKPHLGIMLLASDSDAECLAERVDLSILRGEGAWPGYSAERLFGEAVFPVCAPAFLKAHPGVARPDRLAEAALIEVAGNHPEWMDWRAWLRRSGLGTAGTPPGRAAIFNTYALAVQAAVDGLGVALGWGHLVDPLLAAGRLVRPLGALEVRTRHGYYLLTRADRPTSAAATEVADWLRQAGPATLPRPAPGA